MKKKRKKFNQQSHQRDKVVGLIVKWSDTSPEMDTEGFIFGGITHRNPVYRLVVDQYYAKRKDWIVQEQYFYWSIEMTLVFKYENGTDQRETRELTAFTKLADLGEVSLEQFRDAMRHGKEESYSHTEFVVECLGKNIRSAA